MADLLTASGKPLFFKLAEPEACGIAPPPDRLGQSVRTCVRSLSVMQKEALVACSRSDAVWRLASDEGAYLDGDDAAPCPLDFLTAGMIASYMEEIRALARQRGMRIDRIKLVQDNFYTMEGSALRGTMIGGAKNVDLTVKADGDFARPAFAALVADAAAASPLNGLLRGRKTSLFTLTHNGREIAPDRAQRLPVGALSDPGDRFDAAQPAPGDWSEVVVRDGPSPKAPYTTSAAGSSLTDEQSRLLHIRGICMLRDDGMKQIDLLLFNPHGTNFRVLSDEAPVQGGQGRAPDAASYVSAGLGFCFMTQFGRYAKIARKDLKGYRIVQDTHFSLGGASGGTGRAGVADPVETHVFLDTGEDDEFARTSLDMAERTCFLHALCRTDLKVRTRVEGWS